MGIKNQIKHNKNDKPHINTMNQKKNMMNNVSHTISSSFSAQHVNWKIFVVSLLYHGFDVQVAAFTQPQKPSVRFSAVTDQLQALNYRTYKSEDNVIIEWEQTNNNKSDTHPI